MVMPTNNCWRNPPGNGLCFHLLSIEIAQEAQFVAAPNHDEGPSRPKRAASKRKCFRDATSERRPIHACVSIVTSVCRFDGKRSSSCRRTLRNPCRSVRPLLGVVGPFFQRRLPLRGARHLSFNPKMGGPRSFGQHKRWDPTAPRWQEWEGLADSGRDNSRVWMPLFSTRGA
jgi:hypothetical protein